MATKRNKVLAENAANYLKKQYEFVEIINRETKNHGTLFDILVQDKIERKRTEWEKEMDRRSRESRKNMAELRRELRKKPHI